MGDVYSANHADYTSILNRKKEQFYERWQDNQPSPTTGLKKYVIVCTLGQGTFGKVKLAKDRTTEELLAVKILNKLTLIAGKQVHHVLSEKRILGSIRFPFTIWLVESYKDADNLYLFMPFISGGELFKYLRRMGRFEEKEALFYAAQVFLALEYLHHCTILYRDLKPENILLDMGGYIKLTDFGFAKTVDNRTITLCGTPEYMAPEVIRSRPYGKSVDWWTFGILIFEFVAGHSPFYSKNVDTMSMFTRISQGKYKLPSSFSSSLKRLCNGLIEVNVTKRLGTAKRGASEIKEHDWFRPVDWISILNRQVTPFYLPEPFKINQNVVPHSSFSSKRESKNKSIFDGQDVFAEF